MLFFDTIQVPLLAQSLIVNYPIMHHCHDDIRMVSIRFPKDEHK
jgi:hypothetical protein